MEEKEHEKEKKQSKGMLWIIIAIFAVVGFISVQAMRPGGKSVCEGWLEHKVADLWSADYEKFDGSRDATLQGETTIMRISSRTESGTLSIRITDSKDNEVFAKEDLGTAEFKIEVPQAVHVIMAAQQHAGGFQIEYMNEG